MPMNDTGGEELESSPSSYIRVIRQYGHSRALALGPILPKDWLVCRVEVISSSLNEIIIKLERIK